MAFNGYVKNIKAFSRTPFLRSFCVLGTIVNSIAIILGSIIGLLIKGGLKKRYEEIVLNAVGLSVLFVGISGAVSKLMLKDANPILFIVSLAIGGFIGEWIDIEKRLGKLGDMLQARFAKNESGISHGFVTASLLFCVGTMAILGSIESGVKGVHTTLFAKSILDGITSIIFSSTMGVGVVFSAVSVFVYQGTLTILSSHVQNFLTADMLREISIVGGIIITALGLNMLKIKAIKVGNLLPAIFIPVLFYLPVVQNIYSKIIELFSKIN